MRNRRPTIAEQRYPDTPEFQQAACEVMGSALDTISAAIWAGYDALKEEVFDQISNVERGDEGERSVTQLLAPRISRALTGFEAFYCQPGVKEMESRLPAPAQAPEYDLAFVLWGNERVGWPLEAKLIPTHDTIAPYVADINNEFMTCRYAPFSAGGAMVAYVMDGEPERFFLNVALNEFKRVKVDTIVLNGDIIDCYNLSRWEKDPNKRNHAYEMELLTIFLDDLIKMFPKVQIVYKLGNHDERYEKFIYAKSPEFVADARNELEAPYKFAV